MRALEVLCFPLDVSCFPDSVWSLYPCTGVCNHFKGFQQGKDFITISQPVLGSSTGRAFNSGVLNLCNSTVAVGFVVGQDWLAGSIAGWGWLVELVVR